MDRGRVGEKMTGADRSVHVLSEGVGREDRDEVGRDGCPGLRVTKTKTP